MLPNESTCSNTTSTTTNCCTGPYYSGNYYVYPYPLVNYTCPPQTSEDRLDDAKAERERVMTLEGKIIAMRDLVELGYSREQAADIVGLPRIK